MEEYLPPVNNELTIEQKQTMFSVRNRMINIPANFPKNNHNSDYKCLCGKHEDNQHIYNCELLGTHEQKIPYENIHTGNIEQKIKVFKIFEQNLEEREKLKSESPCDLRDPLFFCR